MNINTNEILESLMGGQGLPLETLNTLLVNHVPEDLHLDYKDGKEIDNPRKAARTIREYLSGFANSDGGILIIGVDENNWIVTGCTAPGGIPLDKWASDCIIDIAGYFSPPPRFYVLNHPDGKVLIISTSRSIGFVPCLDSGKLVYHLRIHDKTIEAPDYLISDLVLGRRQRPYLNISKSELYFLEAEQEKPDFYFLHITPRFLVENIGLSKAEDIQAGLISYVYKPLTNPYFISGHLLSHIELQQPENYDYIFSLAHVMIGASNLTPLSVKLLGDFNGSVPLRNYDNWFIPYIWRTAIYLIAKEMPPIWYQFDVTICNRLLQIALNDKTLPPESPDINLIKLERLSGKRPIVRWEKIP